MSRLTPAEQAKMLAVRRWKKRGSDDGRIARIMGLVEGYYVVRFKGAGPFLRHANDWLKEFEPADRTDWEAIPGNTVTALADPSPQGGPPNGIR